MLMSTGRMSKHPIHEKKTKWNKCWNVAVEIERNCITVIELTCPCETNPLKSHDYKITKYQNLRSALLSPCSHFKLIFLEILSLGFTGSSIKTFETYLSGKKLDSVRITKKCQEVAIRASYRIYCRRNKIWPNPELMSYT